MTLTMKLEIMGSRLVPPPGTPMVMVGASREIALAVICLLPVMVSVEAAAAVSALPAMVSLRPPSTVSVSSPVLSQRCARRLYLLFIVRGLGCR
jgi:hypothetical protein